MEKEEVHIRLPERVPGLDGFFRDTCNPPGMPSKHLTLAEIHEIARRYDTEFR